MRWSNILLTVSILALSACEGGQAPSGNAGASPPDSDKPDTETAQEAMNFLASRLDKIDFTQGTMESGMSSVYWEVTNLSMKPDKWLWKELYNFSTIDKTGVVLKSHDETYSLDPRKLSYPVNVSQTNQNGNNVWGVKFECLNSDCIKVDGKVTTNISLAYSQPDPERVEKIQQNNESNNWHFKDEETARRVAKALNSIISYSGGTKQKF